MATKTSAQYCAGTVAGRISTTTPLASRISFVFSVMIRFTSHSAFSPPDDPVLPRRFARSSGSSSFFQCPAGSPTRGGPLGRYQSLSHANQSIFTASSSVRLYGGAPEICGFAEMVIIVIQPARKAMAAKDMVFIQDNKSGECEVDLL